MNHWIRPSCDSRTGASHLRRGAPCQDACGSVGFRDAAGSPIQVLVVSDGHGGARYVRSDVGARLACAVAMRELKQALAPARVDHPGAQEEWRAWLSAELPGRIVDAWRREVEAHWRADPAADGSGFSPLLYGATLGVLLLTPAWWAHTGLGDWDLVRIEAAGGEALLSEEPEREAGGEATYSLCLERAERHFAARTLLQPLSAGQEPFALLLCSDGLRKSCGSDGDFLTLCRYLVGLAPTADSTTDPAGAAELAAALDHISRHGSGDDISVAVARWAPARQAPAWPEPGRQEPPRLVQPSSGPTSGPPQPAVGTALARDARDARLVGATVPGDPAAPAQAMAAPLRPDAAASSDRRRVASVAGRAAPRRGRRRPGRRLVLPAAALVLSGGALLVAAGLGLGPFAPRPQPMSLVLTPQQRSDLRRQVQDLCQPASAQAGARDRVGGAFVPGADLDAAVAPRAAAAPAEAASESRPGRETALPAQTAAAPLDPRRQQRIAATLASRASVFQRLRHGDPAQVAPLLARSHADPLSALIAFSLSEPDLRPAPAAVDPPGPLQQLGRQLAALRPGGSAPRQGASVASPLSALGVCPELREALRDGWQRLTAADAAPGPTQALPSAAPPVRTKAPRGVGTGHGPAIQAPSPGPATSSR